MNRQMEDTQGSVCIWKGPEPGVVVPVEFGVCHPPSKCMFLFTIPTALWIWTWGAFMEASLCRHDWWNCWLYRWLIMPEGGGCVAGWGWSFHHLVCSSSNQSPSIGYLGTLQKSPHQHKLRCAWKGLVTNNRRCAFTLIFLELFREQNPNFIIKDAPVL